MAKPSPSLPPLRILMGGAVGVALANIAGADAQAQTTTAPGRPPPPVPLATPDPIALPPIDVEGQRASSSGYQVNVPSLTRYTDRVADTPQTISIIPSQLLNDEKITTTREALRNVPGLSLAAGEGGSQGDNLTLRGFSARNDIFLDGMRDFGSYTRDPFNTESIEVLQGPSSITFGRGSTGGIVNQVSKQPGLAPVTAGSLTFGTDGTKRLTADVNRAIDGLPGIAVRLNVMVNENGVANRNVDQYRRFGVAPSIAFGLGTPTRATLSYFHQQEYDTPDYGLPWLYRTPASVNPANFYGYANDDYLRTHQDIVTSKVEHDFSANLSLRNQFRFGNYFRDARITEPQVAYTTTRGVTFPTLTTALESITVNRATIPVRSTETFLQDQGTAIVRFDTGPLNHTMVVGFEAGQETSAPQRFVYAGLTNNTTNLVSPNFNVPFTGRITGVSSDSKTVVNGGAGYVIDTIKFGEQWALLGGIRYDYLTTDYRSNLTPFTQLSRADSLPSYRAALTYKPVPAGTLYVSYGTSFNPSADSLTLATSTAALAPEENTNYEIGAKWEVLDRKLTLSGALFRSEKTNARVNDPNNTAFQILGGDQLVRGFQLGALGAITERWQVTAGYAYLDTEVVKTTLARTQGNALANAPRHSGTLFTTYVLPWQDIVIGGGVNALSSRIASSTPSTSTGVLETAAGYATFQALVRVPIRPGVNVQLNGNNLLDHKYYDLLHPNHVVPGSGRSVLASLNVTL